MCQVVEGKVMEVVYYWENDIKYYLGGTLFEVMSFDLVIFLPL